MSRLQQLDDSFDLNSRTEQRKLVGGEFVKVVASSFLLRVTVQKGESLLYGWMVESLYNYIHF